VPAKYNLIYASVEHCGKLDKRFEASSSDLLKGCLIHDIVGCFRLQSSCRWPNGFLFAVIQKLQEARDLIMRFTRMATDRRESSSGFTMVILGKLKINSVTWVRQRTMPTELPPLVGEVSVNLWGEWVPRGQRDGSLRLSFRLSRTKPLLFLYK
jgi:hypothetical protein